MLRDTFWTVPDTFEHFFRLFFWALAVATGGTQIECLFGPPLMFWHIIFALALPERSPGRDPRIQQLARLKGAFRTHYH